MAHTRVLKAVVVAAFMLSAAACGSKPAGRVFFVSPKDGDTFKADATIPVEFGAEMFEIAAVPQGDVTTVRPNTGHYHIGVDTSCLEAGKVIPKANPWTHFGTGKNTAEVGPLPPGKHTLTVQAGDDKHTTIEGLCQTITINVAG
jgi:hypothetical protein